MEPPTAKTITGTGNIVLGRNAGGNITGSQNFIAGHNGAGEKTSGINNIILGQEAGKNVSGHNNVALGDRAGKDVSGNNNFAAGPYGAGTGVTGYYNIAIGNETGQNVGNTKAGIESTNNETGMGRNNIAIGRLAGNSVQGNENIAIGARVGKNVGSKATNSSTGIYNVAIGSDSGNEVQGLGNIALGVKSGNDVTGSNNFTVGNNAGDKVSGDYNIIMGKNAAKELAGTKANETISIGTDSLASKDNVTAVGHKAKATEEKTLALGGNATANMANSVALGNDSTTTAVGTTTKGADKTYTTATINGTIPLTLNFAGGNNVAGVVSVGSTTGTRRIQNVSAGLLSKDSTDAVNGSQLYSLAEKVANISNTAAAANPDTYFHVNDGTATGGNSTTNKGKIGEAAGATKKNSLAAGVNAGASAEGTVAVGTDAKSSVENGVAIGNGASVNYAQGTAGTGGIAIGKNAQSHQMSSANHEAIVRLGRNKDKMTGGIAIGQDTHARISTIDIGNRDYKGKIGDIDFNSNNLTNTWNYTQAVGATTVGDNSINAGNFGTINGAFNIISTTTANGDSYHNMGKAMQGFGSSIVGTLNAIEGNEPLVATPIPGGIFGKMTQGLIALGVTPPASGLIHSGMASQVVGIANTVSKSNGSVIIGVGNKITNSYLTPSGLNAVVNTTASSYINSNYKGMTIKELADALYEYSNKGQLGSVGITGGANKVDYALFSSINGVGNTLTGKGAATSLALTQDNTRYKTSNTYDDFSAFNFISGYQNAGKVISHSLVTGSWNTLENAEKSIVQGNNHILQGTTTDLAMGNIILGFNDKKDANDIKVGIDNAISIGNNTKVGGNNAIAIGAGAEANAEKTISIGTGNKVNAANSGAIGDPNTISGENSYVIGNDNTLETTAKNTFVLGNNVKGTTENSVILGNKSSGTETATTETEATLGKLTYGTFVGAPKSKGDYVSVGSKGDERQIKNVAAGKVSSDSTDAINGSQLHATNQVLSNVAEDTVSAIGGNATLEKDGNITVSNIANTGKDNINDAIIAARTKVESTDGTVKVGEKVVNGAFTYDLSVDTSNLATKQELKDAKTEITEGKNIKITKDDTKTNNVYTINAFDTTVKEGNGAITVKEKIENVYDKTYEISVAKVTAKANGPITVTGGTVENGVLKDYEIAFDESQLSKTTVEAADESIHVEDVGTNGNHEYKIKAKTVDVVDGVNTKVISTVNGMNTEYKVDVAGDLSDISSISNGTTKVSLNKDENKVNVNGSKITNVADGEVSSTSKEAVNGSQLHEVKQEIHNTQADIYHLHNKIDRMEGKVKKGLANAAAMAGIEFMDIGVNQGTIAAAIGGYEGQQAVAVGLQGAPSENTRVNAKVSVAPGTRTETMYSVGAAYRFNWK